MAYQSQAWGGGIDTGSGRILAEGYANAGEAVGKGLAALFENKAKAKDEGDFLTAQWDTLPGRTPEADEKFHAASLGAKRGMFTGVLAQMNAEAASAPVVPQYQKTASGAGFFVNPKSGTITPEKNIEPDPLPVEETPDPGEWKEMPGMANYLGHWTAKRGFTGATIPKPKDAGTALPQLNFITEPQTGRGIYLDPNGDVVDPAKLLETEEVPGTAQPEMKVPVPGLPAWMPPIYQKIPGTPAQRRPVDAPADGNILLDSPDGGPIAEILPPAGAQLSGKPLLDWLKTN